MSNTAMSALYPEFWAASFDELDVGQYNLQNKVSRDVESLVAKAGDTVNVPLTPDLDTAEDWTPGTTITATGITQETVQVILNKSKRKTIALTQTELSLSPYDLIMTYGVPLAKTIMKAVNLDLYLELMKTDQFVDAISGLDEDDVVDAKTNLSSNEVQIDGRNLVSGVDDMGTMLKLDAFQHVDVSGTDQAMKEGRLIRKFGFDMYENNIISTYTPADVAGAVNNGANYAAGTTTMIVNGFNDDANPIRPGDMFKVAAETGSIYHTVISTTLTTGDTTEITFTPAIATGGVLDTAVITVTPSRSILTFVPSACALAARTYTPAQVGNSSVFMVNGIPIRITVWANTTTLDLNVQYDILYGVKIYKSDRVTRILTA